MDPKKEADILRAVHLHRPAGLHKHMHMLNISQRVSLPPKEIWGYLGTLYKLERADALGPQTVEYEVDFYRYMARNFGQELEERLLHGEESASSDSPSSGEEEDGDSSEDSEGEDEDAQPRRSSRIARKVVRKKTPAAKKSAAKPAAKAAPKGNSLKRPEPPETEGEAAAPARRGTRARTPQNKESAKKRRRK